MIGMILLILIYIFSLVSIIKAARAGKGIFFPSFRRIDEIYFLGMKRVWNTWWGKSSYYLQLIFHLITIGFFVVLIFMALYNYFQSR